ncbi:hypothetical protein ACHAPT_008294 [Fusarium lateritium]
MAGKPTEDAAMADLTIDNITPNAVAISSRSGNRRLDYVMERLITHIHDFARETRLSTEEWKAGLDFLVQVGQITTDVRNESILLSDVLGLSLLVDSIDHPKPDNSTEGSVLGPFHTHDAPEVPHGDSISSDAKGEPLFCLCTVKDRQGNPIEGVKVDVWETDSSGFYDVQHSDRSEPAGRAILSTDSEGKFWFKAIVPVSYPIPSDGPVGKLLTRLNRHYWRPAHMHFMFDKVGWDHLITALYIDPDPYLASDAVFGVKSSLIVKLQEVSEELATQYNVTKGTKLLTYDFALITSDESTELRDENAIKALGGIFPDRKCELLDHLPVPSLD